MNERIAKQKQQKNHKKRITTNEEYCLSQQQQPQQQQSFSTHLLASLLSKGANGIQVGTVIEQQQQQQQQKQQQNQQSMLTSALLANPSLYSQILYNSQVAAAVAAVTATNGTSTSPLTVNELIKNSNVLKNIE